MIYIYLYLGLLLITLLSYSISSGKKAYYIKMVILLMSVWVLASAMALYLRKYSGNNLIVFHVLAPVEYTILALLYRSVITHPRIKKMISISIPLFIVTAILFSLYVQPIDTNNSKIVIIESILVIFLSLFFLREVLLFQQITVLQRFPMFWISTGILSYFTGHMLIEGLLNYLMSNSMELARRAYYLEFPFKYLLFVLFIVGAFCGKAFRKPVKNLNR
jgi:hypothetical protein